MKKNIEYHQPSPLNSVNCVCVCVCMYTTSTLGSCLAVGGAAAAVGVAAGAAGGVASCRSAVRDWEGRGINGSHRARMVFSVYDKHTAVQSDTDRQ